MTWPTAAVVLAALAGWLVMAPWPKLPTKGVTAEKRAKLLRGKPGSPSVIVRCCAGIVSAGALTVVIPSVWGSLIGLGAGLIMYIGLGRWTRPDKGLHELRLQLPEALEMISMILAAGAPIARAVEVTAQVSPSATRTVLKSVSQNMRLGKPPGHAWEQLREHDVWGDAARDLARSAQSGTGVQEALAVHAAEARRRTHERALVDARSIGVRSVVPLVVCFLPAFVLVGVVPVIASLVQDFFG